ncbi:phosphate signaling complex protein PhoU [Candidatus Methylocalor cossyra]|uniref:Phosphate-specific transport system accessory protein PhoU n=1 Tax=Candidatus Methylocalor cossyra TaxID=3108543 RepID=A0ABM9NF37_9GAMM
MIGYIEGHTVKRYDGELNHLHYLVLEMGGLVLRQVQQALAAFRNRDLALAHQVVTWDRETDEMEVQVDREIVQLLARRAPVGGDLRIVIAVSKSISDLERIGDEAVRIAQIVMQLFSPEASDPCAQLLREVGKVGEVALASLRAALEVFDVWDEDKARWIIQNQAELTEEFPAELRRLMTYIMEDARNIGFAVSVILVIKSLELIGHYAQNLAEYAIFQFKGEDVRAAQGHDAATDAAP